MGWPNGFSVWPRLPLPAMEQDQQSVCFTIGLNFVKMLLLMHAQTREEASCPLSHTGQNSYPRISVLGLAGIELNFFIVAHMVLCFGFVLKLVLITH